MPDPGIVGVTHLYHGALGTQKEDHQEPLLRDLARRYQEHHLRPPLGRLRTDPYPHNSEARKFGPQGHSTRSEMAHHTGSMEQKACDKPTSCG